MENTATRYFLLRCKTGDIYKLSKNLYYSLTANRDLRFHQFAGEQIAAVAAFCLTDENKRIVSIDTVLGSKFAITSTGEVDFELYEAQLRAAMNVAFNSKPRHETSTTMKFHERRFEASQIKGDYYDHPALFRQLTELYVNGGKPEHYKGNAKEVITSVSLA